MVIIRDISFPYLNLKIIFGRESSFMKTRKYLHPCLTLLWLRLTLFNRGVIVFSQDKGVSRYFSNNSFLSSKCKNTNLEEVLNCFKFWSLQLTFFQTSSRRIFLRPTKEHYCCFRNKRFVLSNADLRHIIVQGKGE